MVIATDPDSAGWQSGQRAFWRLASLRASPRHLDLPEGIDPPDVLRTEGPMALAKRLSSSTPFAAELIERPIVERGGPNTDSAARIWLGRDLARIIGALPPDEWPRHAQHVTGRLDLPLTRLHQDVLEAGTSWTDDPNGCVTRELATLRHASPAVGPTRVTDPQPAGSSNARRDVAPPLVREVPHGPTR